MPSAASPEAARLGFRRVFGSAPVQEAPGSRSSPWSTWSSGPGTCRVTSGLIVVAAHRHSPGRRSGQSKTARRGRAPGSPRGIRAESRRGRRPPSPPAPHPGDHCERRPLVRGQKGGRVGGVVGWKDEHEVGDLRVGRERPHRAENQGHARDRPVLLGRSAAQPSAAAGGDDDHPDVTRQVPGPAAPRAPGRRARPRGPGPAPGRCRRPGGNRAGQPRRGGARRRRWDGSRRRGRSRPGK